jgi:predicted molibdopterin-dependent oxidoreductase YjgC
LALFFFIHYHLISGKHIREGSHAMPFHFAEEAANMLTNPTLDPIAKIPELKICAVAIRGLLDMSTNP